MFQSMANLIRTKVLVHNQLNDIIRVLLNNIIL